jgi:valyl-tRNA synthetase
VRNIRSEKNIPTSKQLTLHLATTDEAARWVIEDNSEHIKRLARAGEITLSDSLPALKSAARDIAAGIDIAVPLEGIIDFDKERERIIKEVERKESEARGLASRLDNHSFRERAPQEVVQQARERHQELVAEIEKLRASLGSLG